ncbi:hypothetical protein TKK_0006900 [Trichogramma kaykai]|uniref:SH3 domain-containing protein n=1 Tax=Trichogramma kaykai TaxID=54128 RepID=A0ABD2XBZ2_9HYME
MDLLTELRVPTRSAPRPPDLTSSTSSAAAAAAIASPPRNNDMWSGIDPFSPIMTVNQKKKPPPRPPPPKFTIRSNNTPQDKPKNKPTRPTELITNLFGRRGSKSSSSSSVSSTATVQNYGTTIRNAFPTTTKHHQSQHQSQQPSLFNDTHSSSNSNGPISMCLIDLSPPGSPTPSSTTRSSSDGVSVDSFGSDGNSNPSAFTSGSSACSAFEDDFDFFGNLSVNGKKPNNHLSAATTTTASNDPWKVSCTQDPFGSFDAFASSSFSSSTQYQQQQQQWSTTSSTASSILQQQTQIKEIGESNFFAFNDINTTSSSTSLFDSAPVTAAALSSRPTSSSSSTSPTEATAKSNFVMPTIIRAKKPSSNKEPPPKPAQPPALSVSKYSSAPRLTPVSDDNKPGWAEDASPPMPKLPPPPPPPEYMASLEDGLVENFERPYGVALYNFPASQPGDLELKEGDVVYLTKAVNDDWMEGCVGVTEGIFPANFIDVKVPLPGCDSHVVNALYDFNAETFDDLSFKEGATIKVLSRISDEWLYGECNGEKGQFPANFVDRIPSDFAAHL